MFLIRVLNNYNEKLIVTPLEKIKIDPVAHNIIKYFRKLSLVFSKNSKNCLDHGLFEGYVMGRRI